MYVFALSAGAFATDHTNEGLAEARFKALDTDGDDKLSPDEHAAGAKRMFAAMDADKDGTVTVAEMDAAHKHVTGEETRSTNLSSAEKIKVVDRMETAY